MTHKLFPAYAFLGVKLIIYKIRIYLLYLYNYIYIIQVPLRDGGGRGAEPLEDIRLHTEQQRPDGRDGGECEVRGGAVCG